MSTGRIKGFSLLLVSSPPGGDVPPLLPSPLGGEGKGEGSLTSRTKLILFIFVFVASVLTGGTLVEGRGSQARESGDPIFPFRITDASGIYTSDDIFTGRWVVFVVIGERCPGTAPFVAFRHTLPEKERTRILCVGADETLNNPDIARVSPIAMKALGLTGTPMIIGVEDHRVIWRLAGLAPHWKELVLSWLSSDRGTTPARDGIQR